MNTKKKLPIGVSEFATVITNNGYYIDKTMLIADWLQTISGNVTLITRPRRFGKTLNMTMLREFFDITKDSSKLFERLAISQTPYIKDLNQYPVIYLSFKDCKNSKRRSLLCAIDILLQALDAIPSNLQLAQSDSVKLKQIQKVLEKQDVEKIDYLDRTILLLSKLLYQYYHKKVIILIDEYDTPLINAYEKDYYNEVIDFFSSLYSSALKDNPYLERAMLTGIHRIAKESIFSGLNNLKVCTVMNKNYQPYFGLTPKETELLLKDYDLTLAQAVKDMYDGYRFGEQEIYNPWSILNYVDTKTLEPYWVNTASDDMLAQMIVSADKQTQSSFEQLLSTGQTTVTADLQTSFFELNNPPTLWGMFLNSGYLTVAVPPDVADAPLEVRIPNQEVMTSFKKILDRYGGFTAGILNDLFSALLKKDFGHFQGIYENIILTCTSFHDGSTENAYHMLFLGMCVYLSSTHEVKSNIESGYGRADIFLKAKQPVTPNFVIEFKQGENIDELAAEALTQIHEKKYYAGFQGETILLGIAHDLKHCKIKYETIFNNSK